MKNLKLTIMAFLTTLPSMALAAIILFGSVVAIATAPYTLNLGGMKVNEQKIFTLFVMNTSATENINLTTTCDNRLISGSITLPVSSGHAQPIPWNTNGLTLLPANISAGSVQASIQALKQGNYNCTLVIDGGANLNVTYTSNPL